LRDSGYYTAGVYREKASGAPAPTAALRRGRRAAAAGFEISDSSAIKWVERLERTGSRSAAQMGVYKRRKLDPHREFLEAAGAELSGILCVGPV
jgi:hypothetical protein